MATTRTQWSPDEDEKLATMLAGGKTKSQIAVALDRHLSSIQSRALVLERKGAVVLSRNNEVALPKKQLQKRSCMCCGTPFNSEGPHNRLCTKCRTRSADLSPYQQH